MANTPKKNPVEPETKRNHSQNKEQPPQPILRAELQIPHSIRDTHDTNQCKKNRLKWWKFGIEVLTFVVIAGYTCIAYHQWKEMHTSTVAVKEQFRIAKRAWINITECKFREPLSAKISNHIDLTVKNSGETPALQVIYKYRTWIEVAGKTIAEEKFTPPPVNLFTDPEMLDLLSSLGPLQCPKNKLNCWNLKRELFLLILILRTMTSLMQ